jgi:uncharacterized protein YukE
MYDSTISAPTGIDTLVADLRKAYGEITSMMERLGTERGKLLAVSTGEMFVAFEAAEKAWNESGRGQAQMISNVAQRSEEFRTNMLHIDKRAAGELTA